MPIPRELPHIWATWLPRPVTGEDSYEWAVWFKADYQDWDRAPSDFDQTEWLIRHTALLKEQRGEWEARGHDVYVEGQNSFRLQGQSATLAGKPDLVIVRNKDALIIDVKTGRQQAWHVVQVMIYMYALPRALPQYLDLKLRGQVTYRDHTVRIPAEAVDDQFVQNLGALIRRLSADKPARRVPSPQECRFRDISAADCPERVDEPTLHQGETLDF